MKARIWLIIVVAFTLTLAVACNQAKSARTDAQVASEVQAKIASDPAVQSKQIMVQAQGGSVTLSGTANSEAEKVAATNDAAAIDGVKQVLNNLTVQTAAVTPAPEPTPQEPAQQPKSEPAPAPRATAHKSSAAHRVSSADPEPTYNEPVHQAAPVAQEQPVHAAVPAAPPAPLKLTIPDGTSLSVRLIDGLDSEANQNGDAFRATLNAPLSVDDNVAVPEGADVEGRVVAVQSAGRFAGKSLLTLELTKLQYNGHTYSLNTSQWTKEGSSRGASTAKKVGAGAAIGAIIGGIAGGGKGAAIGSAAGAGVGGGAQAATKGQQIKLDSEAVLAFKLQTPLTVTAASTLNRNTNRQPMQ
jgi:hypothetical protein